MRIAVLGTGGIGGYFGGRLAAAGHDVTFVARGAHLDAIRAQRARRHERRRRLHRASRRRPPTTSPRSARSTPSCSPSRRGSCPRARVAARARRPGTAVITTQNGVEAPDQVAAVVGRDAVLPGIAKIFAYIDGPGRITHAGGPASLAFDEWSAAPGAPSDRVAGSARPSRPPAPSRPCPTTSGPSCGRRCSSSCPSAASAPPSTRPSASCARSRRAGRSLQDAMREVEALARARGIRLPEPRGRGHDGLRRRPARRRDDVACSATCSRAGRPSSTRGRAPSCASRASRAWTCRCTGCCSRCSPHATPGRCSADRVTALMAYAPGGVRARRDLRGRGGTPHGRGSRARAGRRRRGRPPCRPSAT